MASTWCVPWVDLVGPAHAHMILMTGERFDAKEAERMGLVNKGGAGRRARGHRGEARRHHGRQTRRCP